MSKTIGMLITVLLAAFSLPAVAWHRVLSPTVKGLQVVKNSDFEDLPVLELGSSDVLTIGFDELSHDYHRYTYRLEPCAPDWTPTGGLFESDWLRGFNGLPIEDYENSVNTAMLYTHYRLQFPNSSCRPKMSGNYRLYITDDETDEDVIIVELRVVEPLMNVGLAVTTNTDLDHNGRYQQVTMVVNYKGLRVTRPSDELQVFVMQNGREDNMKSGVRPDFTTPEGLRWEHNKGLIFDAGNEYHKFEVLDPSHPTMGLDITRWDEPSRTWHAWPLAVEERRSYIYDVDANGASLQRNSDNYEIDNTSEYVYVHYQFIPKREYTDADVVISGRWTTEEPEQYVMSFDPSEGVYGATVLQKLGYYNYMLQLRDFDGTTHPLPEEGSFFQTENRYQGLVYYRRTGERSWRLVGFQEIVFETGH